MMGLYDRMVTVLRSLGLSVRIYKDDHPPAHVHVVGDGMAKIDLLGPEGRPMIVWTRGMNRAEVRRAYGIVVENQTVLLERWREIHGV
ncbi:DUF4160 domain-containing protein [Aureimonas pseudogalii]|uniref:DUF4160 domain-containing protein n=1 Tax=Aureimonas pseudogalii TaxID=1744844 RepID=A0A7W6H840_9HYPH|nr:DUF4160 domain-containing protein [Aureimonas pseudogalii]MBB4000247.1 hypothetical protein [Aureimonas pseudogalii]